MTGWYVHDFKRFVYILKIKSMNFDILPLYMNCKSGAGQVQQHVRRFMTPRVVTY